ncbi:MAG: DsbC family protein [Azoarcus sp.]|jgi:thiol:disulfide interchange protein DsbC|nr:DsbC family protein [Azoarcus sp.]
MKTPRPASVLLVLFLLLVTVGIPYHQFQRRAAMTPKEIADEILASADGEIDLDNLPLSQAIKQVHGKGDLILVTFEDPNCPFCARLDEKLARLDNATLYTFLLPILSDDSTRKSRLIWCADDPATAWNDWMLKRRLPADTGGHCDTSALTRNLEIGERLGIRGVPYLLRGKNSLAAQVQVSDDLL